MKRIPGAIESNAGDEFHIIWAARRCVELLRNASGLSSILVEDISEIDSEGLEEDKFLSVDLAEYFLFNADQGQPPAVSLPAASKVVLSQLKYSTRHPSKAWTASRLCTEKGTKRAHSVLSRFSDTFKELRKKYARDEVRQKLTIKLISNQPALPALLSCIDAVSKHLREGNLLTCLDDLTALLSEDAEKKELTTLFNGSQLSLEEFAEFLPLVNLSCAQADLDSQRNYLGSEVAQSVPNFFDYGRLKLQELVRSRALPGGSGRPIVRPDVLLQLDAQDEEDLFPAPSRLEPVENPIETPEWRSLAERVIALPSRRLLVHGPAGVGKTTVLQEFQRYLPPNSEVVIYDCYGLGTFRVLQHERHTDVRAIKQLANEIAIRLGESPLVQLPQHRADIYSHFNKRVAAAANLIERRGGLLVLIIDAADNSIMAAREAGQVCFVPDLWNLDLPANVRLVMSARSGPRAHSLAAPQVVESFEIRGFDPSASARYLRGMFPNATPAQCETFHDATLGNPRTQYYAITQVGAQGEPIGLEELIASKPKQLMELFEDRWDAATRALSETDPMSIGALLSVLNVPIDMATFAEIVGMDHSSMEAGLRQLEPGAVIEGKALSYRDEDFETFIHGKVDGKNRTTAHAVAGRGLGKIAHTNLYAARYVAQHLENGEMHSELIALALGELEPRCISDELLRHEVMHDRLLRALRIAHKLGKRPEVIRLMVLAADVLRSDSAIYSIIKERPELAALYAEPRKVAKHYLQNEQEHKFGEAQFRCAALLSRSSITRDRAIQYMRMGWAWLRRELSIPRSQQRHDSISNELLASEAEAEFFLKNPRAAFEALTRWRPFGAVLHAAWRLAPRIAENLTLDLQKQLWAELPIHPFAGALFLVEISRRGLPVDTEVVQKVAGAYASVIGKNGAKRIPQRGWSAGEGSQYVDTLTLEFFELAASAGVAAEQLLPLVEKFKPSLPKELPDREWAYSNLEAPLRAHILIGHLQGKNFVADDYLPDALKKDKLNHAQEQERDRYLKVLQHLGAAVRFRIDCRTKRPSISEAQEQALLLIKNYHAPEHYYHQVDPFFRPWAWLILDAVLACSGDASSVLEMLVSASKDRLKGALPDFKKAIARRLVRIEGYRQAGLRLLAEAVDAVLSEIMPAREKWEFLLDCAGVAQPYDDDLGRRYYQNAVDAAKGFDASSVPYVEFLVEAAKTIDLGEPLIDAKDIPRRLGRMAISLQPYVESADPSLPQEEILHAVTRLDVTAGAQAVFEWDAHNFSFLGSTIESFVLAAYRRGQLTAEESLSAITLAFPHNWPEELIEAVLDDLKVTIDHGRERLARAIPVLSYWIQRDVPVDRRSDPASHLVKWCEANGFGNLAGIEQLKTLCEFTKRTAQETAEARSPRLEDSVFRTDRERPPAEVIAELPRPLLANFDAVVSIVQQERGSYRLWSPLFDAVRREITASDRLDYLSRLSRLALERWEADVLCEEYVRCVAAWKHEPHVETNLRQCTSDLILRNFLSLLGYPNQAGKQLRRVIELVDWRDVDLWELLTRAVAQHLLQLSSWHLYLIATILMPYLRSSEKAEIVDFSLMTGEARLSEANALLPLRDPAIKRTTGTTFSELLWMCLGHPDWRVRWRAIHGAKTLQVRLGGNVAASLVQLNKADIVPAYLPLGSHFFLASARQALFILLWTLADETPQCLVSSLEDIIETARSKTYPHALIRILAASTALNVVNSVKQALPQKIIAEMHQVVRPALTLPTDKQRYKREGGLDKWKDYGKRFPFDSMDTVPYWYAPLARVFGLAPDQICVRAEHWIIDRWGFTAADVDWSKQKLYSGYSYELSSNHHGSLPTVERLKLYLEYHALQMVAGELLDKHKARGKPNRGTRDWLDYLEYKLPEQPRWISDIRMPTPLEPELFGSYPEMSRWLAIRSADFDECFYKGDSRTGWIQVLGEYSYGDFEHRATVAVDSALVAPERAKALMRSLLSTNPYAYGLPCEDAPSEIENGPYKLQGFMRAPSNDPILDDRDPFRGELRTGIWGPGRRVSKVLALKSNRLGRPYKTADGDDGGIFYFEAWSDPCQERQVFRPYSTGRRVWLRKSAMLRILQTTNMAMIAEVRIDHERRERYGESSFEPKSPAKKIYVFFADGQVDTGEAITRPRKEDRERASS